jgi:hypothetical protein
MPSPDPGYCVARSSYIGFPIDKIPDQADVSQDSSVEVLGAGGKSHSRSPKIGENFWNLSAEESLSGRECLP